MKKRLLLISILLCSCAPAEQEANSTIHYQVNTETLTAKVVESPKFNSEILSIPETISYNNKEYKVTSISKNSFLNNVYIKSVTMPNSISSIGYDAFRNCTNLEVVNFSTEVKVLPDHLFAGCTSLKEFINGENVETIYKGVFRDTKLKSVIFNNIKELNINTFFNCSDLEEVTILGEYTSLPGSFFEKCPLLKKVNLSPSLNKIDSYAFKNCSSLELFDFSNINELGVSSFESTSIKSASIKVNKMGKWCFYNCDNLENINVDVPVIEEKCFYDCNNLNKINIDNVKHIKSQAFYNSSVKEIVIPPTVEEISSQAFENSKLEKLSFEDNSSLKIISRNAFYNCALKGVLSLPSSIKSIYNNAFSNNSLEKVKLNKTTSVDNNCFDENVEIEYY